MPLSALADYTITCASAGAFLILLVVIAFDIVVGDAGLLSWAAAAVAACFLAFRLRDIRLRLRTSYLGEHNP